MIYRQLLVNKIKCNNCQEEIQSFSVHDYKSCECGKISVDGGLDYQHLSGNYINLAIWDDGSWKTRREYIKWGRNYDENMKLLPKTEYISIKDMNSDHIYKVLEISNIPKIYREVMEDEIIYKESLIK